MVKRIFILSIAFFLVGVAGYTQTGSKSVNNVSKKDTVLINTYKENGLPTAKDLYLEALSAQRETFNWVLGGTAVIVAALLFATWLYSVKISKEVVNQLVVD